MKNRKIKTVLSLITLSLTTSLFAANSPQHRTIKFKVTVYNVTAANGLSPYLAVVLKKGKAIFSPGTTASAGIAAIAETGNTTLLETELSQNPALVKTVKAEGGPIPAGQSRSIIIELKESDVRSGATLNLVSMIGRSNDSFVALRNVPLSSLLSHPLLRLDADNYDSGSEENTGNLSDFGPGGHPTEFAEGRISVDRGLNPNGDAPEILGWGSVAAKVLVERIQ